MWSKGTGKLLIGAALLALVALAAAACAGQESAKAEQPQQPAEAAMAAPAAPATGAAPAAPATSAAPAAPQQPAEAAMAAPAEEAAPALMAAAAVISEGRGQGIVRVVPTTGRKPIPGGTMRVAGRDVPCWDVVGNCGWMIGMTNYIFDSLTHWKRDDPAISSDTVPRPELAESWEWTDSSTIVWTLRKGVKFHDRPPLNGRELTADDVVFSFLRRLVPTFRYGHQLGPMTGVTALDRYTVEMKFSEPFAPFMTNISGARQSVDSAAETVEEYGSLDPYEAAIGTGPWMYDAYIPGVRISMVRHHDYFRGPNGVTGEELPYIERFEFPMVKDAATRMAMLRSGLLDAGPAFDAYGGWNSFPEMVVALADRPDLIANHLVVGNTPTSSSGVSAQQRHGPWQNLKLREAVQWVHNIECKAWCGLGGGIYPAIGLADTHPWFVSPDQMPPESAKYFANFPKSTIDIPMAQQLFREGLVELGYDPDNPSSFKTEITASAAEEGPPQIAERIAGELAEYFGIDVTVNIRAQEVYNAWKQNPAENFVGLVAGYNGCSGFDADDHFYGCYHSESVNNLAGINDPELDAMIEAGRREMDPVRREQIYRDIQLYLVPNFYHWGGPIHTIENIFPEWVVGVGPQMSVNLGWTFLEAWLTLDAPGRQ